MSHSILPSMCSFKCLTTAWIVVVCRCIEIVVWDKPCKIPTNCSFGVLFHRSTLVRVCRLQICHLVLQWFVQATWSSSDLFRPPGPAVIWLPRVTVCWFRHLLLRLPDSKLHARTVYIWQVILGITAGCNGVDVLEEYWMLVALLCTPSLSTLRGLTGVVRAWKLFCCIPMTVAQ